MGGGIGVIDAQHSSFRFFGALVKIVKKVNEPVKEWTKAVEKKTRGGLSLRKWGEGR